MNQSNIKVMDGRLIEKSTGMEIFSPFDSPIDCSSENHLHVRRNRNPNHENYIEMSLSRLDTYIKQGREIGEKYHQGNVIDAIFYCIEKQFEDLNCAVISYLHEISQDQPN